MTTILNAFPKPALFNWGVKVTAEFAVAERKRVYAIAEADEASAVEFIKGARWKVSNPARDLGIGVHASIATGTPPTETERPYVSSFDRWMTEAGAETVAVETTVVSEEHGYGGTIDRICDIPGLGRLVIDIKTGNVYDEAHLQVAAYMAADAGLPDGIDGCGILDVSADRTSLLLTSDPGGCLETFLAVKRVAEFAGMLKTPERGGYE